MNALRAGIALATRLLPAEHRGRDRLLRFIDERIPKNPPHVIAPMKLGYRMHVDLRSRTEVFAYYTGRYDSALIAAAMHLLPQDGVALDIGANIGFWTVPLAQRGNVVAFEPVPVNAGRVLENAGLNGVGHRVELRELGLSDDVGGRMLSLREDFERGADTGNAAVVIDASDDQFASLVVPVDTLDHQAVELGLDRVDVIKMDVEGHEDFVLRGARRTLERFRPVIFVEWNRHYYDRRGVDATVEFASALAGLDYRVLRREDHGWEMVASFTSPRDIDDLVLSPVESFTKALTALKRGISD